MRARGKARAVGIEVVLGVAAVVASVGCSSCGGDQGREPPAPAVAAVRAGAAELRAHCSGGLVPPATGYARIVEVRPPGDGLVFMHDVNDQGVAVGSVDIEGHYHAFRWTERGGLTDLGTQPGFGTQSFTSAIAADGAIGGQSDRGDGTGTLFGYRWTATGGRTQVCPAGCSVWDLNAAGQVVGLLPGQDPTTWQAFLWTAHDGLKPLGTLGGARSSASGVSDNGLIVGNAQAPGAGADDVGHAFLYDSRSAHPVLEDLNRRCQTPGWVLRAANDVNDKFVTGYGVHDGQSRAFRLSLQTGAVEDLGTLGGGNGIGWAVDAAGDVVGWVAVDAHTNVAFVWGPSLRQMTALGDLVDPADGWQLQQANGINSHGVIVGMATHHGVPVGFQLTLPLCGT